MVRTLDQQTSEIDVAGFCDAKLNGSTSSTAESCIMEFRCITASFLLLSAQCLAKDDLATDRVSVELQGNHFLCGDLTDTG